MEAMYEEEDSIYESLKRSEKFNKTGATLKGSLILDWEGPNLDKSGMDYSSVELNSRGSLHEASKDHKSARNSTQGYKTVKPQLYESPEIHTNASPKLTSESETGYTFNRCHFTYVQPPSEVEDPNLPGLPQKLWNNLGKLSKQKQRVDRSASPTTSGFVDVKVEQANTRHHEHSFINSSFLQDDDFSGDESVMSITELSIRPESNISKSRPKSAYKSQRTPLYSQQETQRKRQMLTQVQGELSRLSDHLRERNQALKKKEQAFAQKEKRLWAAETKMQSQLDQMVTDQVQKTISTIEKEYFQSKQNLERQLDESLRENRRLQSSLKDAMTSNRTLRDQNKGFLDRVSEGDQKIEHLNVQLRELRQRNERLKNSLVITKTQQSVETAKEVERKKIRREEVTAVGTQTAVDGNRSRSCSPRRSPTRDLPLRINRSVDCLVSVLHGLLVGYREATFSAEAFDAISGAFETVLDFAGTQSGLIAGESLMEAFLGYTLRFMTTCQLRTDQRVYLAQLAYNYHVEKEDGLDVFDKSRLFLSTMTLSGVKEASLIHEMFELIAQELADDGKKRAFLDVGGLYVIMQHIHQENGSITELVSAALLCLCADGDWQNFFLSQILYFLPDLVRVLESCPVSEVLDNVSVVLQKLSSRPESRLRLAAEPRLIERLQSLANSTPGFYGGGGDVTTDGEPNVRSADARVSEFLWLNVQSVLSHLK